MTLNPTICYRAMMSRDRRFDGRFFAGVVTTGVYCRPVCPAPKPKRGNVRFFSCATAAEEQGFRPCLRCRPEASPGTPAWQGTSTTVSRALRLVGDGFLDRAGVDELAERLGVGSRHLRRLFVEHLGATPVAIAQTRRVHFAKTLLDQTTMSITDVALCSGFTSIRRFNDAFRRSFDRTPSEIRRDGRGTAAMNGRGDLRLRAHYRPPFDWESLLKFIRVRAVPGVEIVDGSAYRRVVGFGDDAGVIEVSNDPGASLLLVRVPSSLSRHADAIYARVRKQFDLSADPAQITDHLSGDPVLERAVRARPGLRLPGAWDPFETSIRAVLGQQISVAAATTIAGRIVERYGTRFDDSDVEELGFVFPSPSRLRRARLSGVGLPGGRIRAIRSLAGATAGGAVRFDGSMELDDFVAAMCRLDGIGPWTANYIAMRACGEPDAFPSGDLALRRAAAAGDATLSTEKNLISRAEAWRPWRAYATMYLWSVYADAQ